MYFLMIGYDRKGATERRAALRQEHVDYWLGLGRTVLLGGPLLDAAAPDAAAQASVLLIEAADAAEARAIADADPFTIEGVFASVEVSPMRLTLGSLLPR